MAQPPPQRSPRRREDARFLAGRARFLADAEVPPGCLHAHLVRSPHAHARIRDIAAGAARAAPGVAAVLTGADLAADGLAPLPCAVALPEAARLVVPPRHALARDRVRHVGEPVAVVLADSPAAARDAAERVAVAYEPLPAVVDARAALAPGAPPLHEEAPGNLAFAFEKGDRAATEAAIAAAAHVVALEVANQRVHAAPLEPRGALACFDAASGRFRLLLSGQGLHAIRAQLAAVFGLPEERFHLVAPDVGGGFGLKNPLFPEYVLALWAARRLGRPVRWLAEPSEEFAAAVHARDAHAAVRLALDAEGRFLALEVAFTAGMGAYLSAGGPGSTTNAAAAAFGGVYAIPTGVLRARGAFTNTAPIEAYRGAGKPEINYAIERAVEEAARRLGMDPLALRRRNMIGAAAGAGGFPHRTALGTTVDGGRFAANLEAAERRADRAGFAARRADSARRGRLRGLGLACFLETARGAPNEWAAVRFAPDGGVELAVGTQSNGQGHETSFAQVAADRLGLPVEAFRLVQADTDAVRYGNGHGGARSLHLGGAALVEAIGAVLAKARVLAAHLLQADPAELAFAAGRFVVPGSGREVALRALARAAADPAGLPDGLAPGLAAEAMHRSDRVTFPNGCHAAEVEVDPETGVVTLLRYLAVDDYGRLVNPLLVRGQVQGGLAQGIGQALCEAIAYEAESGQLLTGSPLDYALPRAADLPPFEVVLDEGAPTAANPLGVKGCGQAGAIAAPPTVMAAVLDALAPLGVTRLDMPATPERVWRAIRAARGG
ncbi:xanthine dehydrogenase family protein molybdopterin-binding subunit [Caldovatus aquaticus]|uniref:Xanthine dehydrogenase family protein molybdopterin-binding subunit n=1 Tax=Caldovatus aquaticus TaxID=2865671 RepID=A0ABS7F2W9_9PROT|nr:xanthine dehydrogenase family protein molybdopterin-binding subunit [Caldovatus aquaticus]